MLTPALYLHAIRTHGGGTFGPIAYTITACHGPPSGGRGRAVASGGCNGPDDARGPGPRTARGRCLRLVLLVAGALALYLAARWLEDLFVARLEPLATPADGLVLHGAILVAVLAYIVLMAVPFMPSAEIGLCLLMMFGARIALLVYAGTVLALTLAWLVGRLIPPRLLARAFGLVGLGRVERFVQRLSSQPDYGNPARLLANTPGGALPFLLHHRYLALAVVFNLPGNIVLGGGGGIALAAGMSRLFPFPAYLLTVALAVAPVPLIVFLAGLG